MPFKRLCAGISVVASARSIRTVRRALLPLLHPPRGALWPATHGVCRPRGGFIGVAHRAGIGNFVFVGHAWIEKRKRVSAHFDVGNSCFNLRHVAGHALTSGGALFVMRMFLQRSFAGAIQRHRTMAIQAEMVRRLSELRIVLRTVDVM